MEWAKGWVPQCSLFWLLLLSLGRDLLLQESSQAMPTASWLPSVPSSRLLGWAVGHVVNGLTKSQLCQLHMDNLG